MSELLVKVKTQDAGEIVGVLVDTHMVPQQNQPQFSMTPDKKLVQGPQQMSLALFGLVAHPGGFIFAPMGSILPLFPDDFPGMPHSGEGHTNECSGDTCSRECECGTCPPMPSEENPPVNENP